MIELEVIGGPATRNKIVTNASHVTIGRSQADTLVIPDPYVSWHHGEIFRQGDMYAYRDLSSTHGTVLRRKEVERRVERVQLNEGDRLVFAGTDSVLAVNLIAPQEATPDDFTLTLGDEHEDVLGAPTEVFANDAKALRAILHLDEAILTNESEGRSGALRALTEQIAELYPALDYVAVLHQRKRKVEVVQSLSLLEKVVPRTSSKILRKLRMRKMGFAFDIQEGQLLSLSSQGFQELSARSAVIEHDTSGICVPLDLDTGKVLYLQMERASLHGEFDQRDLNLMSALATRTAGHLHHLTIQNRYVAASQQAALGIFAKMLGHDIKGALAFAPYAREEIANPSKHAGIVLGVERAHSLAVSLQYPAPSCTADVAPFSLRDMIHGVLEAFSSMFSGPCRFEGEFPTGSDTITTHEELLRRVIWNLALNAYTAHVNLKTSVTKPHVTIRVDSAKRKEWIQIAVRDNAGGMPEKTRKFFQQSFSSIAKAYKMEEALIQVVKTMADECDARNRVGLFFTAVAVNDMDGSITVERHRDDGTVFRIQLPNKIERLRGYLEF